MRQPARHVAAPRGASRSQLPRVDDDDSTENDRDERVLQRSATSAAGRRQLAAPGIREGMSPGCHHGFAWGGALRRMTDFTMGPIREDGYRFTADPGRFVPVGFARYVSPQISPADFEYYRLAGWRVAVPRAVPGLMVGTLLERIFLHGPQSAGYVRLGDTLVPAALGPGDRSLLAGLAPELDPLPLDVA